MGATRFRHPVQNFTGYARVFSGLDGRTLYTWYGNSIDDLFGGGSIGDGDVNADGLADIMVGIPFDDQNGAYSGSARIFVSKVSGVHTAANGNVGIGTMNPTEKLEVLGTVKATTFSGDGSGLTSLSYVSNLMRLQPGTPPSNPSEGAVYMDSTTHKLMVYDGTVWQPCW